MLPAAEVTVKVAEALLPGERARDFVFQMPDQPDGTTSPRLKVAVPHEELSLSITDNVKFTGVPAVTCWLCDGETLTVGFVVVQEDEPASVTWTVAPALLTSVTVIAKPAAES